MKIPKSVKIGGIKFNVVQAKDWTGNTGETDGEIFYDKKHGNVIYIYSELTQEAKEVTLFHEALHAMNATMDHEFLDSLAQQIYQFVKDNKFVE